MQIILYCLATAVLMASTQVQAQTASLKDRLKAAQTEAYAQHEKVMIEASQAIKALPRNMDGTWAKPQVQFVLSLMNVETDVVYRQQMIEDSAVHLKDSHKLIVAGLKEYPKAKAKELLFDIDAVISVHEHGNNQMLITAPAHESPKAN